MSASYKQPVRIHHGVEISDQRKGIFDRRVIMFDFERNCLTNIKRGSLKKAIPFEEITGVQVDSNDARKLTITFRKNRPYQIQAQSPDDRNIIWNLVRDIIHRRPPPSSDDALVLKSGSIQQLKTSLYGQISAGKLLVFPNNAVLAVPNYVQSLRHAIIQRVKERSFSLRCVDGFEAIYVTPSPEEREQWVNACVSAGGRIVDDTARAPTGAPVPPLQHQYSMTMPPHMSTGYAGYSSPMPLSPAAPPAPYHSLPSPLPPASASTFPAVAAQGQSYPGHQHPPQQVSPRERQYSDSFPPQQQSMQYPTYPAQQLAQQMPQQPSYAAQQPQQYPARPMSRHRSWRASQDEVSLAFASLTINTPSATATSIAPGVLQDVPVCQFRHDFTLEESVIRTNGIGEDLMLAKLLGMGFERTKALAALEACGRRSVQAAVESYLAAQS